jgi:hypothetical protein
LALTRRVANPGCGFADPRILGEPLVRCLTQRTIHVAEEHGGGAEGLALRLDAGGNGSPRLGAADHHEAHVEAPSSAFAANGGCAHKM